MLSYMCQWRWLDTDGIFIIVFYRHTVQRILACKATQHSAIFRRFHILDRQPFLLCSLAGSVGDKMGETLTRSPTSFICI